MQKFCDYDTFLNNGDYKKDILIIGLWARAADLEEKSELVHSDSKCIILWMCVPNLHYKWQVSVYKTLQDSSRS